MKRTTRTAGVLLAATLVLAGCAGGEDDASTAAEPVSGGDVGASSRDALADGEAAGGNAAQSQDDLDVTSNRSLIRTATVTLDVDDVEAATAQARAVAARHGGFVGGESADFSSLRQVTLTLRVPADSFDDVLSGLAGVGEVVSQHVQAEDVTRTIVDLDARISVAQASIARLTELFEDAASVDDITRIEQELSRREADLQSLQAQLRSLSDQVDLSTIRVTMAEDAPDPEPSDEIEGFWGGLKNGWVALVDLVQVLLTALGTALPFLAAAGIVAAGLRPVVRRRRERARARRDAVPAGPPSPPPARDLPVDGAE